jgi:hypothetical protein
MASPWRTTERQRETVKAVRGSEGDSEGCEGEVGQ